MDKLYNEEDVRAIADSIRFKNEGSSTYTVAKMSSAVLGVPLPNIPKHHYEEAIRVSDNILTKKSDNCLVFGVITDNHINIGEKYESLSKASIKHGSFALELVSNFVGCDFIANLGDNQWDNNIDTDTALACGDYTMKSTQSAFGKHYGFRLVGNHDQTNSKIERQWELIGKHNSFDATGLTKERCYGYTDFADKKVRVICLNTSDYLNGTGGYGMSYEQKDFLMSALDLSNKTDCADWKILLLSHIPLDFYSPDYNITADVIGILQAYANGTSISIQVREDWKNIHDDVIDKTVLSYDYNGKNQAKIIGNIHGHLHNDCFGKLGYGDVTTDIVRVATPNTCYYLAKATAYPDNGDYSAVEIKKTENTAKDTAVTFYVIDFDNEVIHSLAYGAGNDRTIYYVELPYNNLFDKSAVQESTRFNSSGDIIDGSFWCMSTFLPCKEGDIVRIYIPSGNWREFPQRILCTYTEANVESFKKDFYQNTSSGISISDDGHIATITIPQGSNYYRVSGYLTGNVIITLNEEIVL